MTEPAEPSPSAAGTKTTAPDPARAARIWWDRLQPMLGGKRNPLADRGALARLRRASTPLDIIDEEAVFALHRDLGYGRARADETLIPVAVAASVLACVRERRDASNRDAPKPARAAGRERFGDKDFETAALSPGRMRRLAQAREPDDVLRQMRRLVGLCRHRMDVGALAVLILDWFDEVRGPRARAQFAFDYFAAGGPRPEAAPDPAPSEA